VTTAPRPNADDFYIPVRIATESVFVPLKRVRNWIDRDLIYLDGNRYRVDDEHHRRFTELDCVRIGIVGRLAHFGFPPEWASQIVEEMLAGLVSVAKYSRGTKLSAHSRVLGALRTAIAVFHYDPAREDVDPYIVYDSREREPAEMRKYDTKLSINLAVMVELMYQRLEAAGLLDENDAK
jgi:hypothetical protein